MALATDMDAETKRERRRKQRSNKERKEARRKKNPVDRRIPGWKQATWNGYIGRWIIPVPGAPNKLPTMDE